MRIKVIGIGKFGNDFINQLQQEKYALTDVDFESVTSTPNIKDVDILFLFASTEEENEFRLALDIAEASKQANILTVATALSYMGYDEEESSEKVKKFKTAVDVFMLLSYCDMEEDDYRGLFVEGLKDRMCRAVQCISHILTRPGLLQRPTFEDVKKFLKGIGAIESSTACQKSSTPLGKIVIEAIVAIRGYQYGPVSITRLTEPSRKSPAFRHGDIRL